MREPFELRAPVVESLEFLLFLFYLLLITIISCSASGDTTNDSTPSSRGTVTGAVTSIKESGGDPDTPEAAAASANGRSHVTKDVPDDSKITQNNNTKAAAPTNGATEVTGGSDLQ